MADCTKPPNLHDGVGNKTKTKDRRCSTCAFSEEPGAVVPHAGICEGGTGKRCPYLNHLEIQSIENRDIQILL